MIVSCDVGVYYPVMGSCNGCIIIIVIITKKVGSARLRESDIHPISPKIPAPQYKPVNRKKRKEKSVEDYCRDRVA